jgi:shikimate kinase
VESRRPVYERLATATYDTSHRHLDDVAADIVSWIKENDR